jgi:hypothetical protein
VTHDELLSNTGQTCRSLWWPLEDFRNKFLLWVFSLANGDPRDYSKDFEGHWSGDVVAEPGEYDGFTSVRTAC